jgi:uncharacterized protein YegP (UPF0339 family)
MAELDKYLSCDAYSNQPASNIEGFTAFQNETTGLHHFAMLDKNGHVVLKSMGYKSAASRDKTIKSVLKSRDIEENWTQEKDSDGHYMSLRAITKEIARTCHFGSAGALLGWWMPFAEATFAFGYADKVKSPNVPVPGETLAAQRTDEQAQPTVHEKIAAPTPSSEEGGGNGTNIHTEPINNRWKWLLVLFVLLMLLWLLLCGWVIF